MTLQFVIRYSIFFASQITVIQLYRLYLKSEIYFIVGPVAGYSGYV